MCTGGRPVRGSVAAEEEKGEDEEVGEGNERMRRLERGTGGCRGMGRTIAQRTLIRWWCGGKRRVEEAGGTCRRC